jgi:hypothetical protein
MGWVENLTSRMILPSNARADQPRGSVRAVRDGSQSIYPLASQAQARTTHSLPPNS